MAHSTTDARNKAQDAAGKAHDAAGKAVEAGKEAVGVVTDKAREVVGDATRMGQQALDKVGQTAESATHRVGEGVQSLGQSVRDYGPGQGLLGSATESVASTLEEGGKYISQEGLSGMADDLTNLIKRNPIPALLVGVGVGFLLARITRS